jgi:tetratricopeptide (TPR) repeat protein
LNVRDARIREDDDDETMPLFFCCVIRGALGLFSLPLKVRERGGVRLFCIFFPFYPPLFLFSWGLETDLFPPLFFFESDFDPIVRKQRGLGADGGDSPSSQYRDNSNTNSNNNSASSSPSSSSPSSSSSIGRRFDRAANGGGGGASPPFGRHQKTGSFGGNKVADPIWIDDDCEVDDEFCFSDDGFTPDVKNRRDNGRRGRKISYEEELSGSFKRREIENERKMVNRLWDKPTTSEDLLHITSHAPVNRTGKAAPKEAVNTIAANKTKSNKKQNEKKKQRREEKEERKQKWFYTKVTFVAVLLNFVVALPSSVFTQLPSVFTGLGVLKALDWLFPNSRNRLMRISRRIRRVKSSMKNRNISFPRLKFARLGVKSIANIARLGSVNAINRVSSRTNVMQKSESFENLIKMGQKKNETGDTLSAVEIFTRAVERQPMNQFANIALSKSLSDRVFEPEIFKNRVKAKALADEAVDRAQKAVEIDKSTCQAHVCLAVAYGRAQMFSNENREKVELGKLLKESLDNALKIDPNDDMALHVMGRYEWSMANLNGITKMYVKMMYGALAPGSAENAEKLFKRCIELNPNRLIHKVELAKMLFDLKRYDEAHKLASEGRVLPMEDVNSEIERKNADEIIRKSALKMARSRSSMMLSKVAKSRTPLKDTSNADLQQQQELAEAQPQR